MRCYECGGAVNPAHRWCYECGAEITGVPGVSTSYRDGSPRNDPMARRVNRLERHVVLVTWLLGFAVGLGILAVGLYCWLVNRVVWR